MAGAITVIIAPPSACSTRDARSVENCPVKSGKNPQVKDPIVKSMNPIRNIFFESDYIGYFSDDEQASGHYQQIDRRDPCDG